MIPPLDARGLLPAGEHVTELEAIPPRFCINGHRWKLWDGALEGLTILCAQLQSLQTPRTALVLGGSFFSDKALPDDIEATLVFPPWTPSALCWEWAKLQPKLHLHLKSTYKLDFYPSLPGAGHNDFSNFFQYVGPKTAEAKNLLEKDRRGVLRVLRW